MEIENNEITFYEFIKLFIFNNRYKKYYFGRFDIEMIDGLLIDNSILKRKFDYENSGCFYRDIRKICINLTSKSKFKTKINFEKDNCKMDNIEFFSIENINLINLPDLSDADKCNILRCPNNEISNINYEKLPNNLMIFNCNNNNIEELKFGESLLYSLQELSFSNNKIKKINGKFMELVKLCCTSNQLNDLDFVKNPKKIRNLYCGYNIINELPNGLINCKELYCRNNPIKILPENLNKNVKILDIRETLITEIKKFNNSEYIFTSNDFAKHDYLKKEYYYINYYTHDFTYLLKSKNKK